MAFEDSERRRTILLGILTLIAVPAIFFATRDDDAVSDGSDAELVVGDNGPSRPPLVATDAEPTFLDGPAADPNPGVAEIAVPPQPETDPIRLSASYRSSVAGVRSCLVKELRSGLTVTIENLDNGRSISCVTSVAPFTQTEDVVMHTDTFRLLADLTEAPINIELTR